MAQPSTTTPPIGCATVSRPFLNSARSRAAAVAAGGSAAAGFAPYVTRVRPGVDDDAGARADATNTAAAAAATGAVADSGHRSVEAAS